MVVCFPRHGISCRACNPDCSLPGRERLRLSSYGPFLAILRMRTTDEAISRMLPSEYRNLRDIEQVKKTWNPILHQEMGRHWDMIREGMKRFSLAYDEVLKALSRYERDEVAEMVCREFLDNTFLGITGHGSLTLQQIGKRSLDPLGADPPHASETGTPRKMAKKANGA